MKATIYAKKRLTLLKDEMGSITKVFNNGEDMYVEFTNGMCLQLHDIEIKNQALEYLDSEKAEVKHG